MTYRQEIEKIYKKIDSLAKEGNISIQDYYKYIDSLIESKKYDTLIDVLWLKYKIDLREFPSIEDFKKNSFDRIKFYTQSNNQKYFNDLLKQKSVYTQARHYYNNDTKKYLGDIIEVDPNFSYNTTRSNILPWQTPVIDLDVIIGASDSLFSAIPKFGDISGERFFYATPSQVIYQGLVYECINSFTWSKSDFITPTFSEYFTQSKVPSYRVIKISDKSKNLLEKYSLAIDILKL